MSEDKTSLNSPHSSLGWSGLSPKPEDFKSYNEFVAANVEDLPEHLIILLPYDGGSLALQVLQLTWLNDFWKGQKNLLG